ncbi:MAG: biotin synthase BioB [Leptospirales bacterium]
MSEIRYDWTREEIQQIYNRPLLDLVFAAATVHRGHHNPSEIQVSSLVSVKTGGCSEDCKYCSQSSLYDTETGDQPMMALEAVIEAAKRAKQSGSTRFCMGTAWREIPDSQMENITSMIEAVRNIGLEVCATMGMVTDAQAKELKNAGLSAYNHNLDSGEKFYENIVSTRSYADRLETIRRLQEAGIGVCSGGIIGMGEEASDRIDMLFHLSTMATHPESVPINILVPVEGTPLKKDERFNFWDLLKTVATARILMPKSFVRLSAGRKELSQVEQAFCFMAGANSVFAGEKLLTTANIDEDSDKELFILLGLKTREPVLI